MDLIPLESNLHKFHPSNHLANPKYDRIGQGLVSQYI